MTRLYLIVDGISVDGAVAGPAVEALRRGPDLEAGLVVSASAADEVASVASSLAPLKYLKCISRHLAERGMEDSL
ncbi:MAG TPA: hypothetical protein VK902_24180 [Rubrobacter sp.]|nr:hypothetical protein [Rubrobacter sp.]